MGNQAAYPAPAPGLSGTSAAVKEIWDLIVKVAPSPATVLISGETGTGKERVAKSIHRLSKRWEAPLVTQNCSALPENLLESTLFGHKRGAFTGANADQMGLFSAAHHGTLFLDEVAEMSSAMQVKLLRVLQNGTFMPVGSTELVEVDVRVVAASHQDLRKLVSQGKFRQDLFFRLNVMQIYVPPLRQRKEDIVVLFEEFAREFAGANPPRLSSAALAKLLDYDWPGNVRELQNEVERLTVLHNGPGEITIDELSERIVRGPAVKSPRAARGTEGGIGQESKQNHAHGAYTLKRAVEDVEIKMIRDGLIRTGGNLSQLAKELGITRSRLSQKCMNYGLNRKT